MAEKSNSEEDLIEKKVAQDPETVDEVPTIESNIIELHLGEDLSAGDCKEITRSSKTRVIVLAGEVDSGKTTLIKNIYEQFLKGPYSDSYFAGSLTLLAFERCCHDARIESGRTEPKTDRTKHKGEVRFLHLKVKGKKTGKLKNLLFTDVSGELYREVRDSSEECKKHKIFSRADHFAVLIDGEKVCNNLSRGKAINDAFQILRQCIDSNMLNKNSYIDVVLTKLDHLKSEYKTNPELESYLDCQRRRENVIKCPV